MSRQMTRAARRAAAWDAWMVKRDRGGVIVQAPRDENGIMPRRTRRGIALSLAKRQIDAASK